MTDEPQESTYTKHSSRDGRYYYVKGGDLPFPRFCVIHPSITDEREKWTKDWITGNPAAVLYFSFWKLKLDVESPATDEEIEWYQGFLEAEEASKS